MISLKNRHTDLVISTQIYGGKVVRHEDGALLAQRKCQPYDGKNVRLIRFYSTSSSFLLGVQLCFRRFFPKFEALL